MIRKWKRLTGVKCVSVRWWLVPTKTSGFETVKKALLVKGNKTLLMYTVFLGHIFYKTFSNRIRWKKKHSFAQIKTECNSNAIIRPLPPYPKRLKTNHKKIPSFKTCSNFILFMLFQMLNMMIFFNFFNSPDSTNFFFQLREKLSRSWKKTLIRNKWHYVLVFLPLQKVVAMTRRYRYRGSKALPQLNWGGNTSTGIAKLLYKL